MKNGCGRILSVLMALALTLLLPSVAMAETRDQRSTLSLGCGFGVDESAMSAEQKIVREALVNQYYAAEDEVLAGLVEAGTAAQADVVAAKARRDASWLLAMMDKSSWTDEQTQAYESAIALSGTERDVAVEALVSTGQLTSEQSDALKVMNTSGSRSVSLTDTAALDTASSALNTLRQTLRQSLTDAGITINESKSAGTNARVGKKGHA